MRSLPARVCTGKKDYCFARHDDEIRMMLMTFGLLFPLQPHDLSLSLSFFLSVFSFSSYLDALPCVYVCGCIRHSFLSLSLLYFLLSFSRGPRVIDANKTKRQKNMDFFLFLHLYFCLLFSLHTTKAHTYTRIENLSLSSMTAIAYRTMPRE